MNRSVLAVLVVFFGCQQQLPEPAAALSDAEISQIKIEVRESFDTLWQAAMVLDADVLFGQYSTDRSGVMLNNMALLARDEFEPVFRDAWSMDNENRPDRQAVADEQIDVVVVTPDVALVTIRSPKQTVYGPGDAETHHRYASMGIMVREDGAWRMHSAQQAFWPIEE